MATTTEPWGRAPLTTEGLASLDHPLSLRDFNQDAAGRYWRMIRGEKTYYPREWFDATGTFTGTGTQSGDRAGQEEGFFHRGTKWNWETGAWENPINWANVIGTAAAAGVGGAVAAPYIAGALGGGAGGGAGAGAGAAAYGPLAGGYGAATTSAAVPTALAAGGGGMSTTGAILSGLAGNGKYSGLNTAAGIGANLYAQNKQLGANADALDKSLEATKYSSDTQAKSAAESLAFLRQQAAYDAQVAEANRGGDYQQWAAKQELLGSVGQSLGLPARRIPGYVPLPAYSSSGAAPMPTGGVGVPGTRVDGGEADRVGGPTPTAAPGGYTNTAGQAINLDPAAMTAQVQESFQRQFGRPATDAEVGQVLHYASKPDLYSDQQWRVGPNDYLVQRVGHQSASADPRLAGTAGIIAAPAGYQGGASSAPARRYQTMQDPLGAVESYFQDPVSTVGQLRLPTRRGSYGGSVGSYF